MAGGTIETAAGMSTARFCKMLRLTTTWGEHPARPGVVDEHGGNTCKIHPHQNVVRRDG